MTVFQMRIFGVEGQNLNILGGRGSLPCKQEEINLVASLILLSPYSNEGSSRTFLY